MPGEFSEWFERDFPRLVGFVMTLGAGQCAAEDAAQTAFAEAYARWDDIAQPRAWVRTVATRAFYRDQKATLTADESVPLIAAGTDEDHADQIAERDLVLAALRTLPPRQREVMAWTIDGFRPEQIALELRTTPENVRKSLQRARERLKGMLEAHAQRRYQ
ncbi:sigma-70 family RNA polymerase sigma factor [Actinomadura sp. KC216]|uniref:sigma-70 family RNA polymerase sigma factor n=1 Tax=Actinomadura sp. KC216 TaxID=2530370 RepID=UPI0014048364|nr:sigma-70 family RNA polymerase sigma factor [Actinomadura sp. KC216]